MSTAPTPKARPLHLTESERATLLDLIGDYPQVTIERIRQRFAEVAGRTVAADTVRSAWVRGYQVPDPRGHLSEREREILRGLCASTPKARGRMPAIARRFAELVGRPLNVRTVRHYLALGAAHQEVTWK